MLEWTLELTTGGGRCGECEVRAESRCIRLAGEGRGVERFNRFYRQLDEAWLAHCGDALAARLGEGRYYARQICSAEESDGVLAVTICRTLCRRGRVLDCRRLTHRWAMPRGCLLPDENCTEKKNKSIDSAAVLW